MPTADRLRVLIVDDDHAFAELLATTLAADPRLEVVATAANGQDAVEAVEAGHIDLVLMDIDMPVLDGVQATRRICARSAAPRIVVVTGDDSKRARTAIHAGAEAFVTKLRAADTLLPTIRALTDPDAA